MVNLYEAQYTHETNWSHRQVFFLGQNVVTVCCCSYIEEEKSYIHIYTCTIVLGGTSVISLGFGEDRKFKIRICCVGMCVT